LHELQISTFKLALVVRNRVPLVLIADGRGETFYMSCLTGMLPSHHIFICSSLLAGTVSDTVLVLFLVRYGSWYIFLLVG